MGGPVDAVVVAAGASQRMGGRDKLDAPLLGRPLLAWAIEALELPGLVDRIIVVGPPERVARLADEPHLRKRIELVPGGLRRQESVAAGVRASSAATVLVHDGARPLATTDLARRVADAAIAEGAAIPVVPLAETVKRVAGDRIVETVARDDLATAQTPQGFRRELLERAWAERAPSGAETWTDEAALLEAAGIAVRSVPGEVDNLKVTVAEDLVRAEWLLAGRLGQAQMARTGFGRDSHPFGPGDGLALGGIRIAEAPALSGHSDGDVALHAVADALLGAAALGDLGRLFPAGDPATRGVAGAALLQGVVGRLRAAGYAAREVDVTIVGARPRLGEARLDAMRGAIASLLGLDVAQVSVKASSGNLAGDEGAGRVISARAVASVVERPLR
jgi:2-C-methyl-D-erythritol 4-phosphate cytidylyltransferase/2-C-methyl-D-erythritol 2,4-cyclodiphosphate synthase